MRTAPVSASFQSPNSVKSALGSTATTIGCLSEIRRSHMNKLSSFYLQGRASARACNRRLSLDAKTLRRRRVRVGLLVVVFCAALQPFSAAQEQPKRPLIDPSEMRHKPVRAAVTTPPAQTGR